MRSRRTDFGITTTPPLIEPAKNHGGDGLSVRLGNLGEHRVREDSLLSFGKGRPGFVNDSFGLEEGVRLFLLTEGVRFDLVHRGLHLVVEEQVLQALVRKARDPDRADGAFLVEALQGAPGGVVVAVRLVQKHEVDRVKPQFRDRLFHGPKSVVVLVVLHPDLRRDEDRLAREAALADRFADFPLVEVGGRRVDRAVADFERVQNAALRVFLRDLKDAEADRGHHDAVVETNFLHGTFLRFAVRTQRFAPVFSPLMLRSSYA